MTDVQVSGVDRDSLRLYRLVVVVGCLGDSRDEATVSHDDCCRRMLCCRPLRCCRGSVGVVLFRLGKLPESILAYQQALKIDPNDMDAKYNLEYVRRILKQNAEKQPTDQSQPSQMKSQPSEEEKEEGEQNPEDQKQAEEQQASPQEKMDEDKMSREEAERILNALKNDEKDLQKKRKAQVSGKARIKKDW